IRFQGRRQEDGYVNVQQAQADATALYEAGEKKLGTDESIFNSIIANQSRSQLCMVFAEYGKVAGHDIVAAIESEFSGNLKEAYLTIIQCIRNRPEYFADKLHNAMKGFGTDDETLIRVIVSRSERDLVQVKDQYYEKYQKSLESCIKVRHVYAILRTYIALLQYLILLIYNVKITNLGRGRLAGYFEL
ncbi:unnamed protein product, partial [Soboliphyme baturini]|uniref:Annexin n=1 Tax=Soboliphyme baturini TaxID=241478 RepID=A0A183ITH0_9BILA